MRIVKPPSGSHGQQFIRIGRFTKKVAFLTNISIVEAIKARINDALIDDIENNIVANVYFVEERMGDLKTPIREIPMYEIRVVFSEWIRTDLGYPTIKKHIIGKVMKVFRDFIELADPEFLLKDFEMNEMIGIQNEKGQINFLF